MTLSLSEKPEVIAPHNKIGSERIWFIQLLRAVAILLVVFGHVFLNFWCANQLYCSTLRIEPLRHLVVPDYLVQIFLLLKSGQIRPELIGVAVFFMVSGFVIPISVERYGSSRFLVLRIFRLFPTYVVALSIICFMSLFYAFLAHTHFPYSPRELISSLFFYDFGLSKGFVDPVVWTLRVEVAFYLLAALLAAISSMRSFRAIFCAALTLSLLGCRVLLDWDWLSWLSVVLVGSVGSLIFMLIGTAFYNYYKKHWDLPKFLMASIALYLLFIALVRSNDTVILIQPYTLGLIIFGIAFACQNILRKNRLLDWFAEISYPLYLLHCVSGAILTAIIFPLVPNPFCCTLISLLAVLIVCQILHKRIETPGIKLGKSLTKQWQTECNFSENVRANRQVVPPSTDARLASEGRVSAGLIAILLFLAVNIYLQWFGQAQLLSLMEKKGRHLPEKVQLYVGQQKAPDVLLMGSSRGVLGLDPWVIEEVLQKHGLSITALNLSIAAAAVDLNYLILKNFIVPDKKPKVIVYALSEFDILGLYPPDNHYRSLLRLPYANLLSHLDDWLLFAPADIGKRLSFMTEQLIPIYRDRLLIRDTLAFVHPKLSRFLQYKAGKTDVKGYIGYGGYDIPYTKQQIYDADVGYRHIEPNYDIKRPYFGDLDLFVSLARKHGIELILVNMPVSKQFRSYWKDDNTVDQYCNLVDEYARANRIPLLNVYKGISKYSKGEVEFWDSNHLLGVGAKRVSNLIATRYLMSLFDNAKVMQNPTTAHMF